MIDQTTNHTEPATIIKVRIKTNYGTTVIYPADHKSQIFADMLGQKTLTRRDIEYIKALNFKIDQVYDEICL